MTERPTNRHRPLDAARRSLRAAASSLVACCSKLALVPLRRFEALPGSFTPSMANISRLMSPCASQIATTAANTRAMTSPSVLTKWAIVVKYGAVSPHNAMNVTCSRQSCSIPLCRAPGVFPAVIAISPGGGDSTSAEATTRCLEQAFTSGGNAVRHLVLSASDREPRNLASMHRLRDVLRASAPPHWRWTAIDGAGLGHTETPLATIPPGIRFIHDASVWDMPSAPADSVMMEDVDPDRVIAAFYATLSARIGSPVSPSRKWMLEAARTYARRPDARAAESAVRRLLNAYPEDLEGYAMLSRLALKRNDPSAARRALEDAMRMLERLEFFDHYDRERKREIIRNALALIER